MHESYGRTAARVLAAFAAVVGLEAVFDIVGPACIEGAVAAFQDICAVAFA